MGSESSASQDMDQISLTVNPEWPAKIISSSQRFAGLCGPSAQGANFIDLIDKKAEFHCYLQHVMRHFLSIPPFEGKLVLKPPFTVRAGIKYSIDCSVVDALYALEPGDDRPDYAVRLTLSGVKQAKK